VGADEAVLTQLAGAITTRPADRPVRVGIDGVDGAGKSTFAAALAAQVRRHGRPTIESTVDGFHQPRARRYRQGRDSPDGFYEDSYDYDALRSCLLDPLGPDGDGWFRRAAFDHRLDQPVDAAPEPAPPGAVLVFDGLFLHRPQLRGIWDYSVFLQVDFAETFVRMARRDGCPPDPGHPANRRYVQGQRRYLAECRPAACATVVVDNTDPRHPVIVRGLSVTGW
jgi:uridine kinase